MNIFGKTKKVEFNDMSEKDYKRHVERLERRISELLAEKDEMERDFNKGIINIEKDNQIILKRKDQEVDVIVQARVEEMKAKIATLTLENGNYKKEVEILTKAFENLGFDVKDMKDILNKLVDGIVSKNVVKVIK